jgi:hypothetical protein
MEIVLKNKFIPTLFCPDRDSTEQSTKKSILSYISQILSDLTAQSKQYGPFSVKTGEVR